MLFLLEAREFHMLNALYSTSLNIFLYPFIWLQTCKGIDVATVMAPSFGRK